MAMGVAVGIGVETMVCEGMTGRCPVGLVTGVAAPGVLAGGLLPEQPATAVVTLAASSIAQKRRPGIFRRERLISPHGPVLAEGRLFKVFPG